MHPVIAGRVHRLPGSPPAELVTVLPLLQREQGSEEELAYQPVGRWLPFLPAIWSSATRSFRRNGINYLLEVGVNSRGEAVAHILRMYRDSMGLVCGPAAADQIRRGLLPGAASAGRVIEFAPPGAASVEARFADGTVLLSRVREGLWTYKKHDTPFPREIVFRDRRGNITGHTSLS